MRLSGERLTDFDYFRQLRRSRTITAAEYAKAKRLLERAEEQHQRAEERHQQRLRLKREEAIIEKRRAKQREKREESSIFNKIRRSKTTVLSLTEVDSKIGFEKFVRFLNSLKDNYTMKIGNTTWVFNDSTRRRLLRMVKDVILEDAELHEDSWGAMVKIAKDIGDTITISKFQSSHRYTKHQGAFFKYTHNTVFDFSRYGVFKTGETQNHEDTCLIVALRNGGLEKDKIDMIKLFIRNRIIPRCKLKDICEKLKITIILFSPGSSCKNSKKVFGTSDRAFHIGIIDEHYFIIEPTQITSYCLAHYDEVKDEKNFHQIIGVNNKGSYNRD